MKRIKKFDLKNFGSKAKEFFSDADNVHTICDGIAVGTYVLTLWNIIDIGMLKGRVSNLETTCDTAFKVATNNDFKAFNNHVLNAYRIDAIIQALKSTHPGITEMIADAEKIAADNFVALPYDV